MSISPDSRDGAAAMAMHVWQRRRGCAEYVQDDEEFKSAFSAGASSFIPSMVVGGIGGFLCRRSAKRSIRVYGTPLVVLSSVLVGMATQMDKYRRTIVPDMILNPKWAHSHEARAVIWYNEPKHDLLSDFRANHPTQAARDQELYTNTLDTIARSTPIDMQHLFMEKTWRTTHGASTKPPAFQMQSPPQSTTTTNVSAAGAASGKPMQPASPAVSTNYERNYTPHAESSDTPAIDTYGTHTNYDLGAERTDLPNADVYGTHTNYGLESERTDVPNVDVYGTHTNYGLESERTDVPNVDVYGTHENYGLDTERTDVPESDRRFDFDDYFDKSRDKYGRQDSSSSIDNVATDPWATSDTSSSTGSAWDKYRRK